MRALQEEQLNPIWQTHAGFTYSYKEMDVCRISGCYRSKRRVQSAAVQRGRDNAKDYLVYASENPGSLY